MRFDLRPLRLTTGWSEPNAVVSRTLSVLCKVLQVFNNTRLPFELTNLTTIAIDCLVQIRNSPTNYMKLCFSYILKNPATKHVSFQPNNSIRMR